MVLLEWRSLLVSLRRLCLHYGCVGEFEEEEQGQLKQAERPEEGEEIRDWGEREEGEEKDA